MRSPGDKVIVAYPHDENFNRKGKLVRIVMKQSFPDFGLPNHIWEVEFDDDKSPKSASYNELWLQKGE